jgi:hypothetical protein
VSISIISFSRLHEQHSANSVYGHKDASRSAVGSARKFILHIFTLQSLRGSHGTDRPQGREGHHSLRERRYVRPCTFFCFTFDVILPCAAWEFTGQEDYTRFSVDVEGDKVYKFKVNSEAEGRRWVDGLNEWRDYFLMNM